MVLWFYGFMVLWFYGFMIVRFCGFMVLWFYCFMALCFYGGMVLWLDGFMVLWFSGFIVSWFAKNTKCPFHVSRKILVSYPRCSRFHQTNRWVLSAPVFFNIFKIVGFINIIFLKCCSIFLDVF